ncbi:tumor necrosis factor receptor superfamily member 9-like, partial [Gracilinanus agilis]|uniref:tumor necrosis factor receptor superfamily member 9-like n=1 Tax=Gracilinanus agilis TaxID=191870 RepID=UPI001CFE3539
CSLNGLVVLVNGTSEKDVQCGPTRTEATLSTISVTLPAFLVKTDKNRQLVTFTLALVMAVGFFVLLTFSWFCFAIRSKKKLSFLLPQTLRKPVQITQEEDACSCGFPEEEQGECEIIKFQSQLHLELILKDSKQ